MTMIDLDPVASRLFAADCAEHVLHIYEARYPEDNRPRRAIEAARAYARGEIDLTALRAAEKEGWKAARAASGRKTSAVWLAASAAAEVASMSLWEDDGAAWIIACAADAVEAIEHEWQQARLTEYRRHARRER